MTRGGTATTRLPESRWSAGTGEPVVHQAGDYTVADVPLRFEAAELTGRVSFDRDGGVAGLYFLNQP